MFHTELVFGNRIVHKWNALPNCCRLIDCTTSLNQKMNLELDRKHKVMCVMICKIEIVGYGESLYLIMPSLSSALMASVN